jgi:hypothetical protein
LRNQSKRKTGKFADILLDTLVNIIKLHPVIEQATEEIAILFFAVNLALCCRIVEFKFLHGIPHRVHLLLKQGLQVFTLVAFSLAFFDTRFDSRVFCINNEFGCSVIVALRTRQCLALLEKHFEISIDIVCVFVLDFNSELFR